MLRTRRRRIGCILGIAGLLALVEPASTADTYAVIDVATLEQTRGGTVRGINLAGEIIGTFRSPSGRRGFRIAALESLGSSTRAERLDGFVGTDGSAANAINSQGNVAGASNTDVGIRAFLWTRTGGFRDLGTLPGDTGSEAWAINRHNDVAGHSSGATGIEAVVWNRNGRIQALGRLRDGDYSRAYAINDRGDVAGSSGRTGSIRAFLWTGGQMEDLGAVAGNDESVATGINNSSQVVGYSSGALGDRAFLWTRNLGMVGLGTLPGGAHSRATAVNEAGDVVGTSDSPTGIRAVLWSRGQMQDLNALIPSGSDVILREAVNITDQGLILVTGHSDEGAGVEHRHDHSRREVPVRVFLLVP